MDRAQLLVPNEFGGFTPHVSADFMKKLHEGDSTIGWEGDPNLSIDTYENGGHRYWEIWHRREDGVRYRIETSPPDYPFDERLLVQLCKADTRRNDRDVHAEIMAHNDKLEADQEAARDEWIAEDISPRLQFALKKDGF